MQYYLNKKSAVSGFLIMVLIITAGFMVIFFVIPMIVGGADKVYADSMCKGSVALREKSYTEIRPSIGPIGVTLAELGTPLLCKTSNLKLPEDKNADKEDVKKEFADLMASCWNRYGEGLVEDVFKKGSNTKNSCQVCYIVNLRETSKYSLKEISKFNRGTPEGVITFQEFGQYLFETPYKVTSEDDGCKIDGGFCSDSDDSDKCGEKFADKNIDDSYLLIDTKSSVCMKKGQACCYTDYKCWNGGGICSASNPGDINDPNAIQYREYDEWDCPPDMKCFIENKNYFTYGEYVQRFGGDGLTMVTADIVPGETYAISFGSPTKGCGWCQTARNIGAAVGAGAAVVAGTVLLVTGVVACPFTVGLGCALAGVGLLTVGTAGGYVLSSLAAEGINDVQVLFTERDINTVYFTRLNQIYGAGEELCKLVESI